MSAPIEQFEYTSCIHSLDNEPAGFKVRTQSPGLIPTHRTAALSGLAYVAPAQATSPGVRAVARGPANYAYRRLDDGAALVALVNDTGEDHTGRSGNFLVHALVVPHDILVATPGAWLDWRGWRRALAPRDDERRPAELAAISASELYGQRAAEEILAQEMARAFRFLKADKSRVPIAARALAAAAINAGTGRSVLIRDEAANLMDWIRTLQAIPPWPLIRGLSVSSYASRPANADLQCILAHQPNHEWASYLRSGAACLLDAVQPSNDLLGLEALDADALAAFKAIEAFYTSAAIRDPAQMVEFNRSLVASFTIDRLDRRFAAASSATAFLQAGTRAPAIDSSTLADHMTFFESSIRPQAVLGAIATVETAVEQVAAEQFPALWPRLSMFLATMAKRGQDQRAAQRAIHVWVSDLQTRALSSDAHLATSLKALDVLMKALPDSGAELSSAFMDVLVKHGATAQSLSAPSAALLFKTAAGFAKPRRGNAVDAQFWPIAAALGARAALAEAADWTTFLPQLEPDEHATLQREILAGAGSENERAAAARCYLTTGETLPGRQGIAFYARSIDADAGATFIAAWNERLLNSREPQLDFLDLEKVLAVLPEPAGSAARTCVGERLTRWLPDKIQQGVAERWVMEGYGDFLPTEAAAKAAWRLNDSTPLQDLMRAPQLCERIASTSMAVNLRLDPDKPALVQSLKAFVPTLDIPRQLLEEVAGLKRAEKDFALQYLLARAFLGANNGEEHSRIVGQLTVVEQNARHLAELEDAALRQLAAGGDTAAIRALAAATEAALNRNADNDPAPAARLLELLARHARRATFRSYTTEMNKRSHGYSPAQRIDWEEFHDALVDTRRSTIGRLIGGVGRLVGGIWRAVGRRVSRDDVDLPGPKGKDGFFS